MAKILIAYYSRRGENYVNGSIRNLALGNTEVMASKIKALLPDADMFRIDTLRQYSPSYMTCIEESQLVGHHAYGVLHFPGELRLFRQTHHPLLHQRRQRYGVIRAVHKETLPQRDRTQRHLHSRRRSANSRQRGPEDSRTGTIIKFVYLT